MVLGPPTHRRDAHAVAFLAMLVASVLVGALATILSGEFRESWAFVLLDMAEVFVASQVVYFLIYRPLRNRWARGRATHDARDATGHAE